MPPDVVEARAGEQQPPTPTSPPSPSPPPYCCCCWWLGQLLAITDMGCRSS